jgi:hypothetical protein
MSSKRGNKPLGFHELLLKPSLALSSLFSLEGFCSMKEICFKYLRQALVIEVFVSYREKLKELQTEATGYMLAEIIWWVGNKALRKWWILCYPLFKISI